MDYHRALLLCLVIGWVSGNRQDEGIDGIPLGAIVGPTDTLRPVLAAFPDLEFSGIPVKSIPGASKGRLVGKMGRLEYRAPTCTEDQIACFEVCCQAGDLCCNGACCPTGYECWQSIGFCYPEGAFESSQSTQSTTVTSVASEQSISQQPSQSDTSAPPFQNEPQSSASLVSEASRTSSQSATSSQSDTADPTSNIPANINERGSSKQGNIGAIVGGSVGGAIVLILVGLVAFFCLRSKRESPPAFMLSTAPSSSMEQSTHLPLANVDGLSPYRSENSGTMPRAKPYLLSHELTPPNLAPTSGYELTTSMQQSNDTQGQRFDISTSLSPPAGVQGVMDLNSPPPAYNSLEGGNPSNAKAVYQPVVL
ncbi:hypothetical protein CPB86DRAFT_472290 [Serendipita vermifera]|nr:hypothetical protein CPB86DRAFT_472290 [Serendipita vermifera]